MSKYIIEFQKTGTICFTSHLDLMRIFKRAFKRTGIALAYSQGFNPHPKMGFAQPLSLGYWGMEEYFECETAEEWVPDQLLQRLAQGMPEGIELKQCWKADALTKTLASHTVAAEYMIAVPMGARMGSPNAPGGHGAPEGSAPQPGDAAVDPDPGIDLSDPRALWHSYMDLEEIQVWKRQKKKKEPKKIDIKPMIREITFSPATASEGSVENTNGKREQAADSSTMLYINTLLDCGSDSNLSPELIITSVCKRFSIAVDRSEISVMRKKILFDQPLDQLLV